MFIVAQVMDDERTIDAVYTEGTFTGPGSTDNEPMIVAHIVSEGVETVHVFNYPVLQSKTKEGLESWLLMTFTGDCFLVPENI